MGGLGGLLLGISAQNVIGILGGMFFGLVFGIGFALFGLIFTAVFNVIAPHIGGLPVELTPIMPLDTGNTTKTSEPAD